MPIVFTRRSKFCGALAFLALFCTGFDTGETVKIGSIEYEVVKHLGKGGFGDVYLGRQIKPTTTSEQLVAIKKVLPHVEPLVKSQIVRLHQKIIDMTAGVEGVARIRHSGYIRGDLGIVVSDYYPLKDATALKEILSLTGSPKNPTRRLFMLLQFANTVEGVLSKLESSGVRHADLKLENILLSRHGLHVNDYDTVGKADRYKGTFMGTITTAAPEALAKNPSMMSDRYSLGAMLFELVTGVDYNKFVLRTLSGDPNATTKGMDWNTIEREHNARIVSLMTDVEAREKVDRAREKILLEIVQKISSDNRLGQVQRKAFAQLTELITNLVEPDPLKRKFVKPTVIRKSLGWQSMFLGLLETCK